jgi:glycosyltransferase involved in cell wall biosynthesis
MKIAIDVRELHGKPTGVGRLLGKLLEEWSRMPAAQAHEFIPLAPAEQRPNGGTLWEQFVLPRVARHAAADVLFAPAYSGPVFSSIPMVVAIHDVSFAAHPEWFTWREGLRRRATARLAARAAEHVVTISEFSKREIVAHLGVEASKISVAYPGVTAFTGPSGATLQRSPDRGTVLSVGSIFNRRHVPELIEGFAILARSRPELQLEIVGDNRTTPRIDLDALVQATGIADRVHLRSYVADHELPPLYAGASAFVFLSEYEGFGLTPLEAMASGLPPVLLDTPVAREICGDAAIYVARPDAALIADALHAVLFEPGQRDRILQAATDVLRRYSWTAFADQVLTLLLDAGSRRPKGSAPHRLDDAPRRLDDEPAVRGTTRHSQ